MKFKTLSVALLAAATGFGAFGPAVAQDKAFVIGCSLPLSGPLVGLGGPIKQGMDLAFDMAAKGDKPLNVKLLCNDSKGDAKETVNIAERLVDDKDVLVSISDFTSTAAMAAADTYKRGGMAQLSPTATHPGYVKMNEFMFRGSGTADTFTNPLADFAVNKLGKKRVAVIQVQSDWGQGMADTFIKRLEKDGGVVADRQVYNAGTSDFRPLLTQLQRSKPDAIFIAMLEEEAPVFMRQRQQLDMTSIPVIDSGVGISERAMKLAGPSYEGMYSSLVYNPTRKTPQVEGFIAAYKAKYSKDPDMWAAYGFDAANLAIGAVRRALPTPTRASVRDQLAKTGKYEGANGTLTIDPATRELERSDLAIVQVKDGKVTYLP